MGGLVSSYATYEWRFTVAVGRGRVRGGRTATSLTAYEKSEIFVVLKKWGNAHGGKGDRI